MLQGFSRLRWLPERDAKEAHKKKALRDLHLLHGIGEGKAEKDGHENQARHVERIRDAGRAGAPS